MISKITLAICGSALLCSFARADNKGMELELLPRGRPFRLTFADPREIRMALGFQEANRVDAVVGNYFSILALKPPEGDDWLFHFGLEGAGYFTMTKFQSRFPLQTADGLIGAYAEGSNGPWQYQLRFTHISAHLADGSSGSVPVPYSREMIVTRIGYIFPKYLNVYAGMRYLAHTIPVLPPLSYQFGGALFVPWRSMKLTPFSGVDLQWGPALPYSPSLNIQVGVALNNPPEAYRSFRFFYAYFTGTDPRGQFYNRPYTAHSIGIEMQI